MGTFTWEPLIGNLYLGTWEPGNLYLGTFNWEPLLGNLYLEPGNLGGMGFGAAPVCSETFTMAEDPKASAVGEKTHVGILWAPAIIRTANPHEIQMCFPIQSAKFIWVSGNNFH